MRSRASLPHEEVVFLAPPPAREITDADCVLVVAQHNDAVILVRNEARSLWELPGGVIDPGEGPRECARRELREESGQHAGPLELRGFVTLRCTADLREHAGYVFWCRIDDVRPFGENGETSSLRLWDGAPAGDIDDAAGTIVRWVLGERAESARPLTA